MQPNANKSLTVEVNGKKYARIPVKTHVISDQDKLGDILKKYLIPEVQPGDTVFVSEKCIAIIQGRSYPLDTIKPRPLAHFLYKFVTDSPYGIGLHSPYTMEMAFREVGVSRILGAALAASITKPLGLRGVFYRLAGRKVAGIDGPTEYTMPPYNKAVTLGPNNPKQVAEEASDILKVGFAVVDANDLGCEILGKFPHNISTDWLKAVLKDNPLGQTNEQTPFGIIREV